MKVYIVIKCWGDHTRIERVYSDKFTSKKIKNRLSKRALPSAAGETTYHVVTKYVEDLRRFKPPKKGDKLTKKNKSFV